MRLWKRRWFVLADYCLFYYKGELECQSCAGEAVRESIVRAVSCYSACYPVSVFMCIWLVAAALPLQAPEVQLVEFK